MTAKEIRKYRTISKQLVEVEERAKMLEQLKKHKVCLSEEEMVSHNLCSKFKILGKREGIKNQQREEFVLLALKYKMRDNNLHGVQLRRRRNWLRGVLETTLGGRSPDCRRIVEEVKSVCNQLRMTLRTKNRKKVEHLVRKFGVKKFEGVDREVFKKMGEPKIFVDNSIEAEDIKKPVIVEGEGETVTLSEEECEALMLGPKFCLYNNLEEEEFETALEECIMKVKWDLMGEERQPKGGLEEIAFKIALGEEECRQIDLEKEEEDEIVCAEARSIFDVETKTFNFAKRRATDLKRNSRVYLPRKARSVEEERKFEAMRIELKSVFKDYVSNSCEKGGKQMINLTPSQSRGLKSIKKRVADGELVILPTDKSGRLSVMTRDTYKKAGLAHTLRDREASWQEVKESQRELNGHVSMVIKVFRIGSYWDHGPRVRETTMGEDMAICPMSLLFKDHKGWSASSGTAPPTRPVVGGHMGINMHLSELVSDILDPVVGTYVGGREIISTEDMVARAELVNESNEGWSETSYWGGMKEGEFESCVVCPGESNHVWEEDIPEVCTCEEMDGITDEGRILITMREMKNLRRKLWEDKVGWDETDLDRRYNGNEVLPEDLQEQSQPMALVGTDVANLYPSLDVTKVVEEVRVAILESDIQWREVDYLEAARYVALNWTEEQ